MKVNLTPSELIDQLRAWFFPKDRSIYLAGNCSIFLPGSYELGTVRIAETTLSASAASITLSNIPQSFRHLLLVCQLRSDRAAEADGVLLRFNGDTGNNYDYQYLRANNATITGAASLAVSGINIAVCDGANARANNFAGMEATLPNYNLATNEKWAIGGMSASFGNVSAVADALMDTRAGRRRNTEAITSITLLPEIGTNFVANSIVSLYGMV